MTLNYKGQEIDICGANDMKIFNKNKKKWVQLKTSFSKNTKKRIFNKLVPLINKNDLINYKLKLSRVVDRIDTKYLQSNI